MGSEHERIAGSMAYAYGALGKQLPEKDRKALAAVCNGVDIQSAMERGANLGAEVFFARSSSDKAQHDGERPWPAMKPLTGREQVPLLDNALLPTALGSWLCDVADRACLPVELVAVPALVAISSLVGSHMRVHPEPQSAWTTPPNLWGAIVAPSGVMKSHAISAALAPIKAMERAAIEEADARERDVAVQRILLEAELKREKARSQPNRENIVDLTESLESLEIKTRRYQTNDPTVEKLGELFVDNPRGLLLIRDELAGWLSSMAKSGQECARAFYLEAWGGDESYTFDRIGRGTIVIPTMCLSVIGAIQPGKLRTHIEGAIAGGEGDDGLLQRIQLLVWPDEIPPWQRIDGQPSEELRSSAHNVFHQIDQLCRYRWPDAIDLDVEAQRIYDSYRDEIENRVRSNEFDKAHSYGSHIGKYRGLAPSLALLFWLIDGCKPPGDISAYHASQGVEWCRWLEKNARKLYAAELIPQLDAAAALAARIRDGSVSHLATVRSIGQRKWSGLATSEAVRVAIDELISLGWVRRESIATGGRPSVVLSLHPELRRGQ